MDYNSFSNSFHFFLVVRLLHRSRKIVEWNFLKYQTNQSMLLLSYATAIEMHR